MSKVKIVQMDSGKLLDSKGRVWYSKPIYGISSLDDELGTELEVVGYEWVQEELPEEPVEDEK
jgi:hypothetical protein